MKKRLGLSFLLILLGLSGCVGGPGKNAEPIHREAFYFNTYITVQLYEKEQEPLLDICMEEAARFEQLFSATLEGSDIWRINHAKGAFVEVDAETIRILNQAIAYAKLTDGMYNPVIGAVSTLWDFTDGQKARPPEKEDVENAVAHTDYHMVEIKENQVRLSDPDAKIDLGGIAKGYIADRMKEFLVQNGVKSAIINLGGNVLTIGTKPDGSPFKVGIQKPFSVRNETSMVVETTDAAVVSSGNYERFFIWEEKLYHHILHPLTGYPVQNEMLGVTILSERATDADALSTACFILGQEKGRALIETIDGVEAVFITGDVTDPDQQEIFMTSGFPAS